jgi:hypothetical protein
VSIHYSNVALIAREHVHLLETYTDKKFTVQIYRSELLRPLPSSFLGRGPRRVTTFLRDPRVETTKTKRRR